MGIRLIVAAGALVASLLVQLTIVNGLPLPGGGTPDLVLLCVIAVGVVGGSQCGLLAGFGVGLALDVAPPDVGLVGQYALVFCLAGYASGKLRPLASRSVLGTIAAAAAIAVAGEALAAGLSLVLGSVAASLAVAATIVAYSSLYDVVVGSLMLVAAIRLAIALGASIGATDDSPAIEVGADAGPAVGWLAGPAVPKIAFESGGSAGAERPVSRRGEPRIMFGSGGLAGAERPASRRGEPRIAFGAGGPTSARRSAPLRSEPRIAFGAGGSAGAGRSASPRREPRIAFGSGGLAGGERTASPRRSRGSRSGRVGWRVGRSARRRREPKIAFASGRSKRSAASTRTVSYR